MTMAVQAQETFPALSAASGHLFVVTYPYSGASDVLETINGTEGVHVLGNIGRPIVPLAKVHAQLQGQATRAGGQTLRHEALGWAFAESIARNLLKSEGASGIVGATLTYSGTDRQELLDALLFLYAFFPNPSFVFVTRRASDISSKSGFKGLTRDEIDARLAYLDRTFEMFASEFPDASHVLNFNRFRSPEALAGLDAFLWGARVRAGLDVTVEGDEEEAKSIV